MIEDLDFDLEDLESRLYSQVYHTSTEDDGNHSNQPNTIETENNMQRQNRYFQPKTSRNHDYIPINNFHNTKATARDFFTNRSVNLRERSDTMQNPATQIVHMINPRNNILLLNPASTEVISHNERIPVTHVSSNHDRYLDREARREAARLRRLANRKRKREEKRRLMVNEMKSDYKKNEDYKTNKKMADFNVHHLSKNASMTSSPEKVVTILDSDTDDSSCVEIPDHRELIVLSSSDESDTNEIIKEQNEIKKQETENNKDIKPNIKDENKAEQNKKTYENVDDDDDDVLLIDDVPHVSFDIIEIDCDTTSITNAETNKNSSDISLETNSTCSEFKKINLTPNKSFTSAKQKASSRDRCDLLQTPDSTSNDFLENIDLQQKKFDFTLHGPDFNENNHHFLKPRTHNSETESTCSTNDNTTPTKNTVFNEVEFETPNKGLFNDTNLESFAEYITPNRDKTNESTDNFDQILTKATKRIRPQTPNNNDDNSDSSSESDYSIEQTSSKIRKTLPDLTSVDTPSTSETSNKRKSENENSNSKKKLKDNSETNNEDEISNFETSKRKSPEKDKTDKLRNTAQDFFYIEDSDSNSNHSRTPIESDLQLVNCKSKTPPPGKESELTLKGFSKYWTTDMDKFYNTSWGLENFNVEDVQKTMSDDSKLWKLSNEDRNQFRYSSPRGPRCVRCRQRGHIAAMCLDDRRPIVCTLCGEYGHMEPRCPNGICTSCSSTGGYATYCGHCAKWYNVQCRLCSLYGHTDKTCPDMWRRYHLTTKPGPIVKPLRANMKKLEDRWCSGCAKNKHYEYKCQYIRRAHYPSTPNIMDYTDIYDFPKIEPFLIHCDLTNPENPTPSTSGLNTNKKQEEKNDPSPKTPNTINKNFFKGGDYNARFGNIYPPIDMIPSYFREQFMYVEDDIKYTQRNYQEPITYNTMNENCNNSIEKSYNLKLDENLFGYIHSMKGTYFLNDITRSTNVSYIINTNENSQEKFEGMITFYGRYELVREVMDKLNDFFNLIPSLENIPKSSRTAFNMLSQKLDKVEKIVINCRNAYQNLLKLQNSVSYTHDMMTKKKIRDIRIQLNMALFGKLLLGDGQKHMNFLYELCKRYETSDNYRIPLHELFDFVDSYSYIFTDSVNHNYESFIDVQPLVHGLSKKNISKVHKLCHLIGKRLRKHKMLDQLVRLHALRKNVLKTSSFEAYNEFLYFTRSLSKHFE